MKLSQDAIREFKAIYHEEFGELLTDAEAQEMGERLLRLFQVIYRPLPTDNLSDISPQPPSPHPFR